MSILRAPPYDSPADFMAERQLLVAAAEERCAELADVHRKIRAVPPGRQVPQDLMGELAERWEAVRDAIQTTNLHWDMYAPGIPRFLD